MQLKPVLGLIQLIFYSVGVIIGAGVYSVLGAAAGLAHQDLWISFLVGGIGNGRKECDARGFLVWGAAMLVIGWLLVRAGQRTEALVERSHPAH